MTAMPLQEADLTRQTEMTWSVQPVTIVLSSFALLAIADKLPLLQFKGTR